MSGLGWEDAFLKGHRADMVSSSSKVVEDEQNCIYMKSLIVL